MNLPFEFPTPYDLQHDTDASPALEKVLGVIAEKLREAYAKGFKDEIYLDFKEIPGASDEKRAPALMNQIHQTLKTFGWSCRFEIERTEKETKRLRGKLAIKPQENWL